MRLTLCAMLLIAALGLVSTSGVDSLRAQSNEGTITGTVYWDRDGDGVMDGGEPPLNLSVQLIDANDGASRGAAPNSPNGRFSMSAPPGTYRVEASLPAHEGICVDAFRGTRGPFSPSDCYGAPLPYYAATPGESFELEAGGAVTADVPVQVRDQMVFSLRAVEEDHYAHAGDTITAMVNGNACGRAVVPASDADSPVGESSFPLLVDGEGEAKGCARQGDLVTFVLNGRRALNEPVAYERFDAANELGQSLPHLHIRRLDLVFAEHWAWFYSDDVRAFDYLEFDEGVNVVATVNGVPCGAGEQAIRALYGVAGSPGVQFYGFGPVLIADTSVAGGCAGPGVLVEFRVGSPRGELLKAAIWQPGVIAFHDVVIQDPPRTARKTPADPRIIAPTTGTGTRRHEAESDWVFAMLGVGMAMIVAARAIGTRG